MSEEILTTVSVRDYFSEALENTLRHHPIAPKEATANYLVDLLCAFISRPSKDLARPLSLKLAEAMSSESEDHLGKLKRVGDDALYVSAFFREHLEKRELDVAYYQELGGTAYRRLSLLLHSSSDEPHLADVYAELATDFRNFRAILADIRLQGSLTSDVGDLYALWLKTRSRSAKGLLKDAGVRFPRETAGLKH